MKVTPIKTHKITTRDRSLLAILDKYLPIISEKSVVAITSKIVSICEGRVVKVGAVSKDELIAKEAQYFLPRSRNNYHVSLTITRNALVATAGIDESNGDGYYVLWPRDPQKAANQAREYLAKVRGIKEVGVIITDSRTSPLRWGVTAFVLAYSGFAPLRDYIGKLDVFGKKLEYTKMNMADNLACAAAAVMGEGDEQTPMAVITDLPDVQFTGRNPTKEELSQMTISRDEDLYAPFIKSVKWMKGEGV